MKLPRRRFRNAQRSSGGCLEKASEMSLGMDFYDLLGCLRGCCLVAAVRHLHRPPAPGECEEILRNHLGVEVARFSTELAVYAGVQSSRLVEAVDEICVAPDEFFDHENLNLQISVLAGGQSPSLYEFITDSSVNHVALLRPFLEVSRKLVHAAIRVRMQTFAVAPPEPFWPAVVRFLAHAGGGGPTARAIAVTTALDMVSDVVLFNGDTPDRVADADAELARHIRRVLDELLRVPDALENDEQAFAKFGIGF
jgi:hypothetical protein